MSKFHCRTCTAEFASLNAFDRHLTPAGVEKRNGPGANARCGGFVIDPKVVRGREQAARMREARKVLRAEVEQAAVG
jgi:hypothetical protein